MSPVEPTFTGGFAYWRAERIRLGHAVDENGYSLPPVSLDVGAVPGETLSERNMRRMTEADRIAFPEEWENEPEEVGCVESDAPDEINPAGVEAAGGGRAGSDVRVIEDRFNDRGLTAEGEVGPLSA